MIMDVPSPSCLMPIRTSNTEKEALKQLPFLLSLRFLTVIEMTVRERKD